MCSRGDRPPRVGREALSPRAPPGYTGWGRNPKEPVTSIPRDLASRPPLSPSLRIGRPRRSRFDPTRAIIDGSSTPSWSMMVGRKLYVGNLAYQVSDADLEQLFAGFGIVESAQVIQDRDTGRSKGFGFVEMSSEAEAQAAIQGLQDHEVNGRRLTVNEAKPREPRSGGGYGGGGGNGGGGRGYGGGGGRRY